MDSTELLRDVQARMQATAPDHADRIEAWFTRNVERLKPWGAVLLGMVQRSGTDLPPDAPTRIIRQLVARLETTNPAEARWAQQYNGLLEFFVRVAIEQLATPQVPFQRRAIELPTRPAERTRVNILAAQIAASDSRATGAEIDVLRLYTGFGGLSLDKVEGQLPESLVPDTKALIDEYYTPPEVCEAVARFVSELVGGDLAGPALEPAAGIGRFISAFADRPDMRRLHWQAVEYSRLSARILSKLFPSLDLFNGPFEEWVAQKGNDVAGTLALVVTNPPYGTRGKNKFADPDKSYREDVAYVYFMRRAFDLLRPNGIGVALVPNGLLSGTGANSIRWRRHLLTRHHLLCAFRLPSSIYPGAKISTDLSFWQARGGELPEITDDDKDILAGRYFELEPHNVLGTVNTSGRRGYEILGDFRGLPPANPRPVCSTCSHPVPFFRPTLARESPEKSLSDRLRDSLLLSQRVAGYLDLTASTLDKDRERAKALHPELIAAVKDWLSYQTARLGSYDPHADRELRAAANRIPSFAALLSVFGPQGSIISAFADRPAYESAYRGAAALGAHAEWLYAKRRRLTVEDLLAFRAAEGFGEMGGSARIEEELAALGWCEDWPDDSSVWLPPEDYYTGDLWPKILRARAARSERARRQEAALAQLIGVSTLTDAAPTLRDTWLPPVVVQEFLTHALELDVPPLHWFRGLLKPEAVLYSDLGELPKELRTALGYINHDLGNFKVEATKRTNPETGEEETAQQALDRERLKYGETMTAKLQSWLAENPERKQEVMDTYSRTFRGYIVPTYRPEPLDIARWGRRVTLRPHQLSGAWRMIKNNGGLLAFDVGVGKTLTGIATMAHLRQIGRARRPIVIVPNSIVWKWYWEITRALPDYRVVVVGSTRYLGRGNVAKDRLDEPSERLQKWSEFKLGLYDVAIVTYSVFGRLGFSEEDLRQFLEETPPALRQVGLKADDLAQELEKVSEMMRDRGKLAAQVLQYERVISGAGDLASAKDIKQVDSLRKKLERLDSRIARLDTIAGRLLAAADPSERNRAIFQESANEWIAEVLEDRSGDGIDFASLHCDFLMIDEAQNMKNLWAVGRREGGVPKYLGAISEGSDRALSFAIQSFLTQRETGGSGVALLSATPAKNSPLELFTLLGFVDHGAWSRLGILDPDYFIDRYLRLELKTILKPDGTIESRTAVVGFQRLNELRDIVFRYGEFKTAQDVGLKLPETKTETELLSMGERQRSQYLMLRTEYENIVTSREAVRLKYKALGILQKMGLCALHQELLLPPEEGWSWALAGRRPIEPSPKMLRVLALIKARPECGHIIFVDNVAMHRWLVDLLVENGIPAERIAVLNAERAPKPLQRQEIAEGFNGVAPIIDPETGRLEQEGVSPKYDIVIANAVAYEGIDLQIRTCRVYHLDLPYEPATLQQRNGRAVRQGNTQSVVEVFYLCSDKSYDAVKLAMIRGKLRWMSDIFRSADRETSNPAAQMDLSIEDMLLMLADDPEAARAAMEKVRERNEQERNEKAVAQAWAKASELILLVAEIESKKDEISKEQARKQALAVTDYLRAVPPNLWPWGFVVDRILSGIPATRLLIEQQRDGIRVTTYRVIWEGLTLPVGAERFGHFGKVGFGRFSWRLGGSHQWNQADMTPAKWAALADVLPGDYDRPAPDDTAEWKEGLQYAIEHDVRWSGLDPLHLASAPDAWVSAIWQEFGERIVRQIARGSRGMPAREDRSVRWERSGSLDWTEVLPPTEAGFAEFMRRIGEGIHSYTTANEWAQEWWHRDLPRRIADPREILSYEDGAGDQHRYRVEKTYNNGLAVVQLAPDRWNLANIRTKQWFESGLNGPFLSLERAKLAARWIDTLAPDADAFTLDDRQRSIVRWIEAQSDLPTLALVQTEYAQRLGNERN